MSDRVPEFDFPAAGEFTAADGALVVEIPAGATSREALFRALVDGLQLPGYFGWNFDALDECLRDLSWIDAAREVVLKHEDMPLEPHFAYSRRIYLQVLQDAIRFHREQNPRRLTVIFPPKLEREVEILLLSQT